MKRARDENRTSETNEKGVDKAAGAGRERNALESTSNLTRSREEEEAELRRKLLEKIRANREDAANGKPTSESPRAESPPAKARKTGGDEGAASSSAGVPTERLKGEGTGAGMGDGDPLPEVEGVPNETLFVGNLSYRVSEAVIIKLFTPYGKVVREQFCYHMTGPRRGEPRGFCFVEYSNIEEATKAIRALHGRKLYGRPLRVRYMTVEGAGRMDYSNSDSGKGLLSSTGAAAAAAASGESAAGKIPPPSSAAGEAGMGAGITKLSLDKKVALLKLKLREAGKSGT